MKEPEPWKRAATAKLSANRHALPYLERLVDLFGVSYSRTSDDDDFVNTIALGDSPIECLFLAGIMARHWGLPRNQDETDLAAKMFARAGAGAKARALLIDRRGHHAIVAGVQVTGIVPEQGRCRFDLALVAETTRFIVELDGFAYHSGPDKMVADRARDRSALRAGWLTVRFVGADVIRDPQDCFEEAIDLVETTADGLHDTMVDAVRAYLAVPREGVQGGVPF